MINLKRLLTSVVLSSIVGAFSAVPICSQTLPTPKIKSVAPTGIPVSGVTIVVSGTNFGANKGIIWVGNGPSTIINWSDTQISAKVQETARFGSIAVMRVGPPDQWSKPFPIPFLSPPIKSNGIIVNDVKVYDNAALQQMLDNARARLANMQFLDQAGISARFGTIQGATMQQSGLALNVGGPPLPGVQTTANTGNTTTSQAQGTNTQSNSGSIITTTNTTLGNSTTPGTEQLQVTAPSTSTTLSGNNQNQIIGPSTQTVTTLTQQNPAIPAVPNFIPSTFPSNFSLSASDLLNEQVQLNSEAAGLALLLEGSLSDQFVQIPTEGGGMVSIPKRRITIGVPVSLIPSEKYKDCLAEIVLTVRINPHSVVFAPPAVTAILPEEKTYNVATINSKSVGFGAGIVTGIITAGANWLWQKQTYYIVQDQDTVALQLPSDPSDPNATSFGWQIRPVLGRKTVSAGMRMLFVQLAFPVTSELPNLGNVSVSTHWKKIDRKLNTVSEDVIDNVPLPKTIDIPSLNLSPRIQSLSDPIDNGDGTLTTHLESQSYFQGTYIKIGGNIISQNSSNALFDPSHIDFTVPASMLATQRAYLVDRSGAYSEIINPVIGDPGNLHCFSLNGSTVTPENSQNAMVTISVMLNQATPACQLVGATLSGLHLVVVIGNKVFGYRDAPIRFDEKSQTVNFRAPIDLLRASPSLTVERILWGAAYKTTLALSVPLVPTIDKAVVVSKAKESMQIALIGANLSGLTAPAGMTFANNSNTGRILKIPLIAGTNLSQIALQSSSGDILLVAMPEDPTASGPALQPHDSIEAHQTITLTVKGSHLDGFQRAEINMKSLPTNLSADKKSIIVHLPAMMVQPPKIEMTFYFKDSHPVSYIVSVFNKHNEILQQTTTQVGQQQISK